jgi:hypothetical protein
MMASMGQQLGANERNITPASKKDLTISKTAMWSSLLRRPPSPDGAHATDVHQNSHTSVTCPSAGQADCNRR